MTSERPNPHIRLSEAARHTLADALAQGGGSWLRLKIAPHFAHKLLFDPGAEGDIVVEVDGISLLLDPPSASRADGLRIDFVQDLHGAGLRFDNPNQPGRVEQSRARAGAGRVPEALGGSFPVRPANGQLARIAGEDADALGLEPAPLQASEPVAAGAFDLDQVFALLRSVYDPEIPVNVVDLGLIYQCQAQPLEDGSQRVSIKMSMTAPGCGMGDVLKEEARGQGQKPPRG